MITLRFMSRAGLVLIALAAVVLFINGRRIPAAQASFCVQGICIDPPAGIDLPGFPSFGGNDDDEEQDSGNNSGGNTSGGQDEGEEDEGEEQDDGEGNDEDQENDDQDDAPSQGTGGGGSSSGGGSQSSEDDDENSDDIPENPNAPKCLGHSATIFVDDMGYVIGGPDNGRLYSTLSELRGTLYEDVIVGTDGPDRIDGLHGDDTICALGGDDRVDGGFGSDVISGGNGNDTLIGGMGHDMVYGEEGNDKIYGEFGDDVLCGDGGEDVIDGAFGNDQLDGGAGTDALAGSFGIDICVNGSNADADCDKEEAVPLCSGIIDGGDNPPDGEDEDEEEEGEGEEGEGGDEDGSDETDTDDTSNNPNAGSIFTSGGGGGGGTGGGRGNRTDVLQNIFFISEAYATGVGRKPVQRVKFGNRFEPESATISEQPRVVPAGTPFTGLDTRLICNAVKSVDRNGESHNALTNSNWTATVLAQNLGREASDIRRALRDPHFCDSVEASVFYTNPVAELETEEVAGVYQDEIPTLVLDENGVPMMEDGSMLATVWNNCVRGYPTYPSMFNRPDVMPVGENGDRSLVFTADGNRPFQCGRYQSKSSNWGGRSWEHPVIGMTFGYNYRTKKLVLPYITDGLIIVKREEEFVLEDEDNRS